MAPLPVSALDYIPVTGREAGNADVSSRRAELNIARVTYDPCNFGWDELHKLNDQEYQAEMVARGYRQDGRDFWERHYPPPKEGQCGGCDGAGERRKRVTLEELPDELTGQGLVARHDRGRDRADIGPVTAEQAWTMKTSWADTFASDRRSDRQVDRDAGMEL